DRPTGRPWRCGIRPTCQSEPPLREFEGNKPASEWRAQQPRPSSIAETAKRQSRAGRKAPARTRSAPPAANRRAAAHRAETSAGAAKTRAARRLRPQAAGQAAQTAAATAAVGPQARTATTEARAKATARTAETAKAGEAGIVIQAIREQQAVC